MLFRRNTFMEIFSCIKRCEGCSNMFGPLSDGAMCGIYGRPAAKWHKLGGCEGATHVVREVKTQAKQRVGQQKQKKGGK